MRSTLNLILSSFVIAATGCNAVQPTDVEPTAAAAEENIRICQDNIVDQTVTFDAAGNAIVHSPDETYGHQTCTGLFEDRLVAQFNRSGADAKESPSASYRIVVAPVDVLGEKECTVTSASASVSMWREVLGVRTQGSWQALRSNTTTGTWTENKETGKHFCALQLEFDTPVEAISALAVDGTQAVIQVRAKISSLSKLPNPKSFSRNVKIAVSEKREAPAPKIQPHFGLPKDAQEQQLTDQQKSAIEAHRSLNENPIVGERIEAEAAAQTVEQANVLEGEKSLEDARNANF